MIYPKSTAFNYIDRNCKRSIVLIPGWASDYRIFDALQLNFNYIIPVSFTSFDFEEALLRALKEKSIKKVSIFGWSLGGFLGAEFSSRYEGLIDETILVSVRRKYDAKNLQAIKGYIEKNKTGFLSKFYAQCFTDKNEMDWFKGYLFKEYCKNMDPGYLLDELDYLMKAEIKPELLDKKEGVRIIHGECDSIAPIKEALEIKKILPRAGFVSIKETGHMPFLKEGFSSYL